MIRTLTPSPRVMSLLIAAPFVVAACTTTASDDPAAEATDPAETAMVEATTASGAPTADEPDEMADTTDEMADEATTWLDIELTDAESGETFTLASLQGDVVALEPMAIWCSNCKAQQDNVKQAYPQIADTGVRFISLGIDPGDDPAALAAYADKRGYEWTFAKSPNEFSRALSDLFGTQILSAPSTPLIVLDADGELVTQEFGFHGPEALLGILAEAGEMKEPAA